MINSNEPSPAVMPPASRIAALDFARGLAIIAMALYHFSWDLSWFALVDWRVADAFGWRGFAVSIAASFLVLAGVSLDLAHGNGIKWRPFWKRESVIVLAAASVSIGTYFAFPDSFVRFGILHCIAASSLIALPFTRLPAQVSLAAGLLVLSLPHWAASSAFDGDLWLWTGLGTPAAASVDYVPLAPWTGATLLGVAISKIFSRSGLTARLTRLRLAGPAGLSLRWLGRHSLPVYLLHQPLLYGLVWAISLASPQTDRTSRSFEMNCTAACTPAMNDQVLCAAACACTLNSLKTEALWEPLLSNPDNPELQSEMNGLYGQCLANPSLYQQ